MNQPLLYTMFGHLKNFIRRKSMLLLLPGIASAMQVGATNYYNTGNVQGNVLASWTTDPGGGAGTAPADFVSGDTFNIRSGTTVTTNAAWTISGSGSALIISGTFTPGQPFTLNGAFINNGTYNNNKKEVILGTGGRIGGTSTSEFLLLTINTSSSNDTVYLDAPSMTIRCNSTPATLQLTQGIFKVGTGHTLTMTHSSNTLSIIGTANGTLASGGVYGSDGGLINFTDQGTTVFNSPVGTVLPFYNVTFNSNLQLTITNPSTVLINGTLHLSNNQRTWGNGNGPIYADNPISTLYVNFNGQPYPGTSANNEWSATSGTVGITPGYPNNVVLVNVNASSPNLTGTFSIGGTLHAGDGTTAGNLTINNTANFTCGGIVIDKSSSLKAPGASGSLTVNGNWTRQGSTLGTFNANGGTVTFGGAGPDTISIASGTETSFNNVIVNTSPGGNIVLNSPVTLPAGGGLTMTSGVINTTATNLLTISNTSPAAISGTGSVTNYINGPLKWNFASGSTNTYIFPVGASGQYLPFNITPNTGANTVTVQAFNAGSGGTPDNSTVLDISNTEYWSLATTTSLNAGSSVSIGRTPVAPYDEIGVSATQNGTYSSVGGTPDINEITNSTDIGTGSAFFFALTSDIVLPVTFVNVKASLQNSQAFVQWVVADQVGILSYDIEKSTDGVHFVKVGSIDATNSDASLLMYYWIDANTTGGYNYYRIRSVENGGKATYSEQVLVVNFDHTLPGITVYPNPVTGSDIHLQTSYIPDGDYEVALVNGAGQVLWIKNLSHALTNTNETIGGALALPNGSYYLKITGSAYSTVLKLVIMH